MHTECEDIWIAICNATNTNDHLGIHKVSFHHQGRVRRVLRSMLLPVKEGFESSHDCARYDAALAVIAAPA